MFGIPRPTPLDVSFGLFGVPVRVSGWFWIMAALFGYQLTAGTVPPGAPAGLRGAHVVMAALCILVSILWHELGHALVARLFGMDRAIVLTVFGGLAYGRAKANTQWWQHLLVSLAGPGFQFLLLGAVLLSLLLLKGAGLHPADLSPLLGTAAWMLYFVNLWWAIVNLVPIYPLDGGQAMHAVLSRLLRGGGLLWTARISLLMCVLVGILALQVRATTGLIFLGFLGVQNFQLMQAAGRNRR